MKRPLTWVLIIVLVGLLVYLVYFNPSKSSSNTQNPDNHASAVKQEFKLKVNSKQVFVDGEADALQAPVLEIDGRTMVPLRFIAEYLQAKDLQYDPVTEEISFSLDLPKKIVADKKTEPTTEKPPAKQSGTTVTIYDQMLTKEREDRIKSIARVSTTLYRLQSITSDGKNIVITIDLLMEPTSDAAVRKITDPMANEAASIFDNKANVSIKAIRKTGTKPDVAEYGVSYFNSSTGKVEFQPSP
jgi:hypothetical protein